mmetsp:Transcript_41324/g.54311  ORF Transcript_41324/g.54311 Transcript_41324/m.54311 type:complete len:655 (+) Transcript_41324:76-2040(+)
MSEISDPDHEQIHHDEEEAQTDFVGESLTYRKSFRTLMNISNSEHKLRMEMGAYGEADDGGKVQTLDFSNISYTVKLKSKQQKTILSNVSGSASGGEVVALMGPSGSGKTSLLNVLSQRINPNAVTGSIFINQHENVSKLWKRKMGFVFQDDLMLGNLTVRQTLLFSARLRLPQKMSMQQKEEKVDALLDLLGLKHCAESRIGSIERRGISGGERKRTAIGVELVTGPSMMFLDEPTSGLDSTTALNLMTLLRKLADTGTIFFASIHQPRSNIFALFDKVILLDQGRPVFSGHRNDLVPYLQMQGLTLPALTTPADWILDLISCQTRTKDNIELVEAWHNRTNEATSDEAPKDCVNPAKSSSVSKAWSTSFWYQFFVLLERQSKQSKGNAINIVSLAQNLLVATTIVALWWQTNNLDDILGFYFFVTINQAFTVISIVVKIFPMERDLMIRERSTGYYRIGAYFLARTLSDIVISYILPMMYALICIMGTGLASSFLHFLTFWFVFLFTIMAAQAWGIFLSTVLKDLSVANMVAFTSVLMLLLVGGFYIDIQRLPVGLQWMPYISFIYWGFKGMTVSHFTGRTFGCQMLSTDQQDGYSSCPIDGDEILRSHSLLSSNESGETALMTVFCVLTLFILVFRLLSYFFLRKSIKLAL